MATLVVLKTSFSPNIEVAPKRMPVTFSVTFWDLPGNFSVGVKTIQRIELEELCSPNIKCDLRGER